MCPLTGEMMFFGYGDHSVEGPTAPSEAEVHYSVVNSKGRLVSTVPIKYREAVMCHDFAVSTNYSVLMDFPLWNLAGPTL